MLLYIIDGRKIKDPKEAHELLQKTLGFPSWYGNNLDALWDQISTQDRWITLKLLYTEALIQQLGEYAEKLRDVLAEGSLENPKFRFQWYPKDLYGTQK